MSYWSKRQEKLNKALEKDEEALKKRLNRIYEEEARRLQKEIAAYYEMYGEEDVIEYRKLLEELSAEDRRLLIEDMEEFARKYPEHKHLLPVRESIYKLDRLQGLQESVRLQQMRIGAQEEEMIREHLVRTAYRGANASAEAMGFGSAFYSMNEDIVKKFVDVPWSDGKSFSERIWENKEKLTNFLNKDIAQGMARGDSYANLTKHLMERMGDVSRRDAYRLIYTEGTYVHAEASITPFEEDFEYYKLSTVGDRKVCSICKGLEDAEPVPISKRVPGENFPPLHPWCRCTFTIEVEDWDKWMDDYVAKHGNREQAEEVMAYTDNTEGTMHKRELLVNEGEVDVKRLQDRLDSVSQVFKEQGIPETIFSRGINHELWQEASRLFFASQDATLIPSFNKNEKTVVDLYRGVAEEKHVSQFKFGTLFIGNGTYGSGSYFTPKRGGALEFFAKGDEGKLISAGLSESANVIKYSELLEIKKSLKDKMDDPYGILEDDGRLALALGYDAVFTSARTYLVLNRGKVVMKDEKGSRQVRVKRSRR